MYINECHVILYITEALLDAAIISDMAMWYFDLINGMNKQICVFVIS